LPTIDYDLLTRLETIIKGLKNKKIFIAIAESCTGGYVSNWITNISGASKVFERGVITYSNQSKIDLLKVSASDINDYGAVSQKIAEQMALNIRLYSNVDVGIGITGIAGPLGGTLEKPEGLVYLGFSTKKATCVQRYIFKTDRIRFKHQVLLKVLDFLESLI